MLTCWWVHDIDRTTPVCATLACPTVDASQKFASFKATTPTHVYKDIAIAAVGCEHYGELALMVAAQLMDPLAGLAVNGDNEPGPSSPVNDAEQPTCSKDQVEASPYVMGYDASDSNVVWFIDACGGKGLGDERHRNMCLLQLWGARACCTKVPKPKPRRCHPSLGRQGQRIRNKQRGRNRHWQHRVAAVQQEQRQQFELSAGRRTLATGLARRSTSHTVSCLDGRTHNHRRDQRRQWQLNRVSNYNGAPRRMCQTVRIQMYQAQAIIASATAL